MLESFAHEGQARGCISRVLLSKTRYLIQAFLKFLGTLRAQFFESPQWRKGDC